MSFNKLSGLQNNLMSMQVSLAPGEVWLLPSGQGIINQYGANSGNQFNMGIPLTGQYYIDLGLYCDLQVFDSVVNAWRTIDGMKPHSAVLVSADAANFRVVNNTGCPVGALITAAGSGGTNGFYGYNANGAQVTIQNTVITPGNTVFTATPSAGGSLWNLYVGGAINTTITATASTTVYQGGPFGGGGTAYTSNPGTNYTRPPIIQFGLPPNQGDQPCILPTATCTISGGAINSITVTNQGAGLLGLPTITVVPQVGDSTGAGAILGWTSGNSAQVGSGTLLAMIPVYPGTAVTAVPTFTFGGTSNPAPTVTAIMDFTITGITQSTAGVAYVGAGGAFQGGVVAGTAANTNPYYDKAISVPDFPPVNVAATTGLPSLAGPYGGRNIQAVPTFSSFSSGAAPSTAAVNVVAVGGATDTICVTSI